MTTTATLPKPDPFADLMAEWRQWSKGLELPAGTFEEIEATIAAGNYPKSAANRAFAADFIKRLQKRLDEVLGPVKFYAVTVEYHTTEHKTVAVAARSVSEAIAEAYQQDDGGWSTYDQPGDSFIGHVAEYPTLDDAENAWGHNAEGALSVPPIPFEDLEDCEKLAAMTKAARALLDALDQIAQFSVNMGDDEEQPDTDSYEDVDGAHTAGYREAAWNAADTARRAIAEARALLPDPSKGGA